METLIDTDYLRQEFDISEDITDLRLKQKIGAASRRMRAWVTDEVYQSVLDIPADEESDQREDFKLAEAHLAMHFAILGLNTPITPKGIIKSVKAEDDAVISYCTPNDTAAFQQMYLDQAEEIIRGYVQIQEFTDIQVLV